MGIRGVCANVGLFGFYWTLPYPLRRGLLEFLRAMRLQLGAEMRKLALWGCVLLLVGAGGAELPKRVYLITVHGQIDDGLAQSVERRTEEAKKNQAELIIYEIDTFGGFLHSAYAVGDVIAKTGKIRTVAYVPTKALSAGALIALSADEIIMGRNSELGDCEPIIPTPEGGIIEGPEKIQSPLRARMRSYAEGKYPLALAEAMVTKDLEVLQVKFKDGTVKYLKREDFEQMGEAEKYQLTEKRVVVKKGELLTMHSREAKEYGFASHLVSDREELYQVLRVRAGTVTVLEPNWAESTVRFFDRIGYLLLMLALICLYMEFQSPGFGLPGITGLALLVIFFIGKYMTGVAEAADILLFVIGVMLLAVELFVIPGFGVVGVLGAVCMLAGLYLSLVPFVVPETPADWSAMMDAFVWFTLSMLGAVLGGLLVTKFIPRTPLLGRLVLVGPSEDVAVRGGGSPVSTLEGLVGKEGVAVSELRPVGSAEIDGRKVSVVTDGDFIETGTRVRVVAVKGYRIVVRRA